MSRRRGTGRPVKQLVQHGSEAVTSSAVVEPAPFLAVSLRRRRPFGPFSSRRAERDSGLRQAVVRGDPWPGQIRHVGGTWPPVATRHCLDEDVGGLDVAVRMPGWWAWWTATATAAAAPHGQRCAHRAGRRPLASGDGLAMPPPATHFMAELSAAAVWPISVGIGMSVGGSRGLAPPRPPGGTLQSGRRLPLGRRGSS